ncbi:Negative regulator of mitotic exit [Mortierella sp. GBA35]|nr:Negative regulator of mitotic exit [Mortierella sp. GBA35]
MHVSLLALVVVGIINLHSSSAQAQPQSCGGAAFAKIGTKFYIQGGATYGDNLIQSFWSLDLASPWSTSSPAWTSIQPPGPYNAFHSAGLTADGSSFITFGRDTAASNNQVASNWINNFDITSKTWSSSTPSQMADSTRRDFYAVTNLAGSKIYILGGNAGSDGSVSSNMLNTYDPATQTMAESPMPASTPQNSSTYAAVWVKRSSTMLMIGGQNGGAYSQSLWTYNPISGGWSTQSSNGPFNHGRTAHCAASNADGTLVAVFGGFLSGSTTGDPHAYILNTATWTWTMIPYSGRGRGNAACTIVDDTFIIWGGFYNNPSKPGGVPSGSDNLLLLTLSTGQWKTSYAPSTALGGNTGGNGTGVNGSGGGLSGGAIGGICAGVAVVIAAVAFLFFRKTWKKGDEKPLKKHSQLEAATATAVPAGGGGHGHGGGGAPKNAGLLAAAAAGQPPSIQYSPQPPSSTVSPTVYDQSSPYHQNVQPQTGYAGYDQHQQQYPPYLQQAPDHAFHHRPSADIYGNLVPEDIQYVDENGQLYRRSYQPEVVAGTPPPPPPGAEYYPPPPFPGSAQIPEKGAYAQVGYGGPQEGKGGDAPYKASIGEGGSGARVDSSPYHDSYGAAWSATTGPAAKRPVGGPQSVQGQSSTGSPVVPGAPQAILK